MVCINMTARQLNFCNSKQTVCRCLLEGQTPTALSRKNGLKRANATFIKKSTYNEYSL